MTDDPPRRRRRAQFTLKMLLAAVLILSLPLSWFAVKMDRARKQEEAISELSELGDVKVLYRYQDSWPFELEPSGPPWLRRFCGKDFFNDITFVDISNTRADDSTTKYLASFPELRFLRLDGTLVTDTGLKQIVNLQSLEHLYLPDQTTADGLEQLGGLSLKKLVVPSHFANDDLKALCCLPSVEDLYLGKTRVTDAGLRHLKALPRLQWVDVSWTRVTEAGQRDLPHVRFFDEFVLASSPENMTRRHRSTQKIMKMARRLGGHVETFSDLGHGFECKDYGVDKADLSNTKITDTELTAFEGAWARSIDLSNTHITDLALVHIARIDGLVRLNLTSTGVTDTGLEYVAGQPRLDYLSVCSTKVTSKGIERVQKMLPHCKIEY